MTTYKTTFHENFNIKTFSEFYSDVLVLYEEFNYNGKIINKTEIGEYQKTYEYDKKNRLIREYQIDSAKRISWKSYTYTKDSMTVLYKNGGPMSIIHKMKFGPEDEKGERKLISECFL